MSIGVLISRMMIRAGKLIRLSFSITVPKLADVHTVVTAAVRCDVSASTLIVLKNTTCRWRLEMGQARVNCEMTMTVSAIMAELPFSHHRMNRFPLRMMLAEGHLEHSFRLPLRVQAAGLCFCQH